MRFDLRLHGRTSEGKSCRADVSVYASSAEDLQQEAAKAAENAPWLDPDSGELIVDGATIVVERVEPLRKPETG